MNSKANSTDCCFVPTNITSVRSPSDLPFRETGFGGVRSIPKHRCDVRAVGFVLESGRRCYDFDNRQRRNGCVFQYTLSGKGCFQSLPGGRVTPLGPGQAFLVPLPSPTRYWLPKNAWWEFCYVILDGDMANDLVAELVKQYGYLWELSLDSLVIDVIRCLHRGVLEGKAPDQFEAAAMGHRLLMEMFRLKQAPANRMRGPLRHALKVIEANYRNPRLTVEEIARAAGYSKYHFSRLFREETGIAPHKYIQMYRIRRASELMASSSLPVKQVAMDSGFNGCAYFCKEFRRWTNRTPTDFRRMGPQLRLDEVLVG